MLEYIPGNEAVVSAVAELGVVMGVVLGPSLSIGLYFLAGYSYPFVFIAILQSICVIGFLLTPNPSAEDEDQRSEIARKEDSVKDSDVRTDSSSEKVEVVEPTGVDAFLKFYCSGTVQMLTATMLAATCMIGYTETGSLQTDTHDLGVC